MTLSTLQQWFASIITTPLDGESIQSPTCFGTPIEKEAARYITPGPTLPPHKRIEIYNQQYWWRLINSLHEAYPLVLRLFGYHAFNYQIAIPYLQAFPPKHWSINHLGDQLLVWLKTHYKAEDRSIIYHAARVDLAFYQALLAQQLPPLQTLHDQLAQTTLYLQPSCTLFFLPYNLFAFRQELLKQTPEYWEQANHFPSLKKGRYYFLLGRTPSSHLLFTPLKSAAFALLSCFEKGSSIEKACQWLETQSPKRQKEALTGLTTWFRLWTEQGILTPEDPSVKKEVY